MKKRILSVITALALCLSLCPTWALAAEYVASVEIDGVTTQHSTLRDAWNRATAEPDKEAAITLLGNVDAGGDELYVDETSDETLGPETSFKVTLHGGGYTVSNCGFIVTNFTNSSLTIDNCSFNNVGVLASNGTATLTNCTGNAVNVTADSGIARLTGCNFDAPTIMVSTLGEYSGEATFTDCVFRDNAQVRISGGTASFTGGEIDGGGYDAVSVEGGTAAFDGCTISSQSAYAVSVEGGNAAFNSCTISSGRESFYSSGGTAEITDCTVTGGGDAVYVDGGDLTINSGTFQSTGDGTDFHAVGLFILSGTARLQGGTFSGATSAIGSFGGCSLAGLLGHEGNTRYAYFNGDTPITAGLDGKTLTGSVTVKPCTHAGQATDNGNGTHNVDCAACGLTATGEAHNWTENAPCTVCGAEAAVKIERADGTTAYAGESDAELSSVFKDSVNAGATFTLLKELLKGRILIYVDCTLDLNGCQLLYAGDCITVEDGVTATIQGEGKVGPGPLVVYSTAHATVKGGTYSYGSTIDKAVDIYGTMGSIVLRDLLGRDGDTFYAYYDRYDKLITEGLDGKTLTGTVTVKPCTHEGACTYAHNENTSTHSQTCLACGKTWDPEPCAYAFSEADGVCTVCGDSVTVAVSGTENLIYDGTEKKPGVTVTRGETPLTAGTDYTVSYTGNKNAGENTATVTVTIGGETYTQNFSIAQAPLTIKASDQTITYGQIIDESAATASGLCTGDTLESVTLTPDAKDVPGGSITPSAAVILNAAQENVTGNYNIVYQNGTLTINKDTSATPPGAGIGYKLDYVRETITVEEGYEVSTAQDGGAAVPSGSITDHLGQTLYIRKVEDDNHAASGWAEIKVTARPTAPSLTKTDETLKGKADGQLTGDASGTEYSTDGGTTWKDYADGAFTGLTGGTTVQVRVKATEAAPHGEVSSCTIEPGPAATVTFISEGSTFAEQSDLSYGDTVSKPEPDPTRTDYKFLGWYTTADGATEWNFETDKVTAENVTIYAKWKQVNFQVGGTVKDSTGTTAINGATVTLMQGSRQIDQGITDNGAFTFSQHIPAGAYNIVTTSGNQTKTTLITIESSDMLNVSVTLPPEGVSSKLEVKPNTPTVVVGGLDEEAAAQKEEGKTVTVSMTVEGKTESAVPAKEVTAIKEAAGTSGVNDPAVEYLDVSITKQVDDTKETVTSTTNVIEIVVPFDFSGKDNIAVLRYHGSSAAKLSSTNPGADGTYREDRDGGCLHIFARLFSTYAVAYTETNYTITFDANGGTVGTASAKTNPDGKLSTLPTPSRSGYSFTGWYTAASGGTQVTTTTVFTENTTIYALWQQNTPTNPPVDPTIPVTGISLDKSSLTLTAGQTERLTATVRPANATNKSVVWSTSDLSVAAVDSNGNVTARAPCTAVITVATRSGSHKAACTVTVVGMSYTVTYDPNGGTGTAPTTADTAEGGTFQLPANPFRRPGYQFTGWSYDGTVYQPGDTFTMPDHDVTFSAQWNPIAYAITGRVLQKGVGVPGVTVRLMLGSTEIARCVTGEGGRFAFENVPSGIYNLVAEKDSITKTVTQEIVSSGAEITIELPLGKTNSVVEIKDKDTPPVVVGGLDDLFKDDTLYTAEDKAIVAAGGTVEFKMEVGKRDTLPEGTVIEALKPSGQIWGLFLDMSITKTVTRVDGTEASSPVTEVGHLITIRIPLPVELQGKDSYAVYRVHNGVAEALPNSGSGERYEVSPDKTVITIFAQKYSTYAIAWNDETPPTPPVTPSWPTVPSGGTSAKTYAITVEKSEHGTVTASRVSAASGTTVTLTATPDTGYVLLDLAVTDSQGNQINLTDKNTFTMPARAVTVKASFAPLPDESQEQPCDGGVDCPSRSFTDLGTVGTWYHEAVDYVLRNGLMNGHDNGLFGPDDGLTRAQLAQILHNLKGRPVVNYLLQFEDVPSGAWYTEAVRWAASTGIVSGYGNGLFGPDDNITREQLAVMLWRYAGSPAATDRELHFSDANQASSWALDALRWAVENGIISGKGGGILDPTGPATRAEAAEILKNFLENQ